MAPFCLAHMYRDSVSVPKSEVGYRKWFRQATNSKDSVILFRASLNLLDQRRKAYDDIQPRKGIPSPKRFVEGTLAGIA
jgi:hypothetical protein